MTLCGISSLVVTDGNVIAIECKLLMLHFTVTTVDFFLSRVLQTWIMIFCTAYLNHWSFTFKTCEVVRPQMIGQPSVQFLPTKRDIVADVVVVSAAMASPAIVTQ